VTDSSAPVRIVLAEPARAPAAGAPPTADVLARLGSGIRLDRVHDAAACVARARGADLVVLDGRLGHEGEVILAALREGGPPVVVVAPEAEPALRSFRAGAADCVAATSDYAEVLSAVALEQIRAWRVAREKSLIQKRVKDLSGYLENIIQNMNSGLIVVDLEGRITAGNPTAEEILGEPSGALAGREVWGWFPEARTKGVSIARTLRDGARIRGAETLVARADGRLAPVGISSAPLVDAEGHRLGAVAIFQDLSEIKQLQRQVLQTEKMASIGQLAAGVAHEINNPMGFIHANLFQMEEYLADLRRLCEEAAELQRVAAKDGSPEARAAAARFADAAAELDADYLLQDFAKALRESLEGSERIRHIVQDLRSFSHRDDGTFVEADLIQCLDSTAHIVWTMMKHSVVLRKDYDALPPVRCLPMQLQQVFMNLIVNAYQAIEERVRQRGGPGEIVLRAERRGDAVAIAVSDDGVGIPPAHLDRIFDPFFTTKEVGVGTGLGLSTSFTIVRRHGGTLRALDREGGGTTFEVELPVGGPGPGPAEA
jgi:PAS domain S-box-containing protein